MSSMQCSHLPLARTSVSTFSSTPHPPVKPQHSVRNAGRRVTLHSPHGRLDDYAGLRSPTSGCGVGGFSNSRSSRSARRNGGSLCTASAADPPPPAPDVAPSPLPVAPAFTQAENSNGSAAEILSNEGPSPVEAPKSFWQSWRAKSAELRGKLSKWGLAAVLAYGLFDGITYTTFFVLAFLSYEKTTGQNPAADLKALLGVVVLMWGGNNVTRPFRVAGAAALAPLVDTGLKKLQKALRLPNQAFAFMICVATFAGVCLSVVGLLILSRSVAIL